MATTVARLEAILFANTRDFDRAMGRSDSRLRRVAKTGGITAGVIGGVLVAGLSKSVKEAMDAERSQARLEKSFSKNVKGGLGPYRKEIEKASKAAIRLGFDDEDLADSLGSLVVATGDYKEAQSASNVAMDLARFKGIELEGATKMLTMAMAGSQRATKQLGISVQPVTTEYDRLKAKFGENISAAEALQLKQAKVNDRQATAALVIDIVNKKLGGQAEAYSKTTEGGIKVFQEQMEEMQEQIGTAILPALNDVVGGLTRILKFFEEHPALGKAVLLGLVGFLVAATTAQLALNLAVLANPYVAATVAIVALAAGVALLYMKVKELRPVLEFIALTFLGLPLPIRILIAALGGLEKTVQRLTGFFRSLWGAIQKIIDGIKRLKDLIPSIPDIPGIGGGGGNSLGPLGGVDPQVSNAVIVASQMGWKGRVTSGFRTYGQQAALYARYLAGGPLAARPGTSSHERGEAVDVTDYGTFGSIMSRLPHGIRLYNKLGARDPVHFSVSGYARGGTVPGPLGMPQLAVVHGGETVTPPGGEINLYIDGQRFFTWIQNKSQRYGRHNGREAF